MAQVPFTSFYLGPLAVYPTSSGLQDPITGAPERGGNFQAGNYCDLSEKDAQVWNQSYNPTVPLNQGRYRIVKINPTAVAGYIGFGRPAAWSQGSTVQQVSVSTTGFNYTPGTYTVSSTTSGGTAKATAQVVIGGPNNGIIAATLLFGGAGFTSVPTFALTELTGGTGAGLLAQMLETANIVQGYDSSALAIAQPRGVFLSAPTAAQVTAGAYVIMQEAGIANILVNSVGAVTAAGSYVAASVGGIITTAAATPGTTTYPTGFLGVTLDLAAANTLIRASLDLAIQQG